MHIRYPITVVLLLLSPILQAGVITTQEFSQTFSISNEVVRTLDEIPGSFTPAPSNDVLALMTFDGFDTSLGDLIGATITLSSTWTHQLSASGTDTECSDRWGSTCFDDMTFFADSDMTLSFGAASTTDSLHAICAGFGYLTCTSFDLGINTGSFDLDLLLDPLLLTSSGSIDFSFGSSLDTVITSCLEDPVESCSIDASTTWDGTALLTYTYESPDAAPVPAPPTTTLFAVCLLGLTVLRMYQGAVK